MGGVGSVPAVFTYTIFENGWSDLQKTGAPNSWVFEEYAANDGHGTRLFDADPSVSDDLEAFLDGVLR